MAFVYRYMKLVFLFFQCKKLLPAAHEDQLRAEMVHIKEKLFKSNLELSELKKMRTEHITMIEDLKVSIANFCT